MATGPDACGHVLDHLNICRTREAAARGVHARQRCQVLLPHNMMERSVCVAEPVACCGRWCPSISPSTIPCNTCLVTFWSPPGRLFATTVTSLNGRMMMQNCNHLTENTIQQLSTGGCTGLAEILDSRTPLKELSMCTDQGGSPITQRRQRWSTHWFWTCGKRQTSCDTQEMV